MAKAFTQANSDARPGCTEYSAINFTGFSPFTLCAWVKSTSNITNSVIAGKWGASGQYMLSYDNKKLVASVNDSGVTRTATSTSDYNTGVWNHVALVFGGSQLELHINAGITEQVFGGTVVTGITSASDPFTVSQYSSGGTGSTRFQGSVSHVCIFNRVVLNELFTVMNSGPRMVSGLVLWFPLIDKTVADVNYAPVLSKTAITGVSTSFTMDTNWPPLGSLFGINPSPSFLLGAPGLNLDGDDDLNNWADSASRILNSTGLNNWQDVVFVSPGYFINAFDSMFFNIADSISVSLGNVGTGNVGDQLVLTDGISIQLSIALSFGDSLSFADSFGGTFFAVNAFGDTLNMTDLFGLQMNIGLIFSDSMTMSDGTNNSAANQFLVTVSDDLNFWADSVSTLSSTSATTYLRQYLNDVVN